MADTELKTKWDKHMAKTAARPPIEHEKKNAFQKYEATHNSARVRSEQLDKPLSARLTEVRTAGDERKNKFQRNRPEPVRITLPEASPRSRGGMVLDARTIEAKQNADAEKAARNMAAQPISLTINPEDQAAIIESFAVQGRRAGEFYDSPYNREQLWNCLLDHIQKRNPGITGWNLESLRLCAGWLSQNGYFEKPVEPRKRGRVAVLEQAPKQYPAPLEPSSLAEIDSSRAAAIVRNREQRTSEIAQARAMSFDQLKEQAQKNYRDKRGSR
jgi:hypothetical protein